MNFGQRQFYLDPNKHQHPYYKTSKQLFNSIQNLKLHHKYTFHEINSPKTLIDQKQKQFERGILLQSAQTKRNFIIEKKRGSKCESPLSINQPQTTRIKTQNSTSRHIYTKQNNDNQLYFKSQNSANIAKNEKEIDKLIYMTFKSVPDRMNDIKPLNNRINNFINKLQLYGKEQAQNIMTKSIQQQQANGDSENFTPTDILKNTKNLTSQFIKYSPRQMLHYSTIKMNFKTEPTTKMNKKSHKIMSYINKLQLRILQSHTEQNKLQTQQRTTHDKFERYKNTEI